jgi:hypothetical protein
MHHHHGGRGVVVSGGSGCSSAVVAINFVCGIALLGGAAFMVVQGLSTGNLGLTLGGGLGCGVGGLACLLVAVFMMKGAARRKRLMTSGVPGQAQILGLTQTGMYVNYQPVVQMQLEITTAMRPPYVVTRRETVPQIMLGRLTSGQPLPVMVDPNRPDDLIILWESALNPPANMGAPAMGYGAAPPAGFGAPPGGYGVPPGGGYGGPPGGG